MKCYYTKMNSPIGDITVIADNENLRAIYWPNQEPDKKKFPDLQRKGGHKVALSGFMAEFFLLTML